MGQRNRPCIDPPRAESNSIPPKPSAAPAPRRADCRPTQAPLAATRLAPTNAARQPSVVMPPLVPGGTDRQVRR